MCEKVCSFGNGQGVTETKYKLTIDEKYGIITENFQPAEALTQRR